MVPSWVAELAVVVNISSATPVGTSRARNDQYVGISPAATSSTPKASAVVSISRMPGRARRAASSAPPSAPTAKAAEASPNAAAPVWNTPRDIRAVVTWKFMPNVATKNISARVSHRLGRALT